MEDKKLFSEEELLQKVEKAAEKGAGKGLIKGGLLSSLPTLILLGVIAFLIIPKIFSLDDRVHSLFKVDEPVANHDTTIENTGILGYTVVDFEDVILGDSEKLKKLEVFRQEVSDATTTTDTGLFNLSVFTKNQVITYYGEAVYTVDLASLRKSDISYDDEQRIVTLKIPHAKQEEINIPEEKIQFGTTTGGLLAFGEITLTPEETYKIQAGAREKMQELLDEQNTLETADRFAKLAVWELFSPIIKSVGRGISLEVEFK